MPVRDSPAAAVAFAAILLVACGGAAADPAQTPAVAPASTPQAEATPRPAWWEGDAPAATAGRPESRVWDVRLSAEGALTFEYLLSLPPEANVFVHRGVMPLVNVALHDAAGNRLAATSGELRPTAFEGTIVAGRATLTVERQREGQAVSARVEIWVFTGTDNSSDRFYRELHYTGEVAVEWAP